MLAALRSLTRSPIAIVVIIAPIVAAFVFVGINNAVIGGGNAVSLVGPERVTARDLQRVYSRELTARQRETPGYTREQAEAEGLGDAILGLLINQAALDAKASALGLAVSDEHLSERIREFQAFASPFTGEFDASTYQQVLRDNQLNVTQFENDLRGDIRRQQFLTATAAGLTPPLTFARTREAFRSEQRTVRALLIPPALAADPGEPTDEALQTLIDESPQFFQVPETRRFTLVRAAVEDFTADIDIPEEDLRAQYDIQLANGQLADPPTRTFQLLTVADQAQGEELAAALRAGAIPADAAAERGLERPVSFDAAQAFQVPDPAISDAVFASQAGDVRVVEGRLGWRVITVSAAEDPVVPTFEQMREALQFDFARSEAEGLLFEALSRFEEARSNGETLEGAAAAAGLFAERFGDTTRDGIALEGGALATLQATPGILRTVFELPEGFASDLNETETGGYFFARVDAITPQRVPPLADVRERAEAIWSLRAADDALGAIAEDALARAQAGEDLADIAAEIGAPAVVEQATLGRADTAGPFNASLVGAAFATAPDSVFAARAGDGRTRAVAVVTEVTRPALDAPSGEVAEALVAEMESDLLEALQGALLAEYPVRTDPQLRDLALGRTQPATP